MRVAAVDMPFVEMQSFKIEIGRENGDGSVWVGRRKDWLATRNCLGVYSHGGIAKAVC